MKRTLEVHKVDEARGRPRDFVELSLSGSSDIESADVEGSALGTHLDENDLDSSSQDAKREMESKKARLRKCSQCSKTSELFGIGDNFCTNSECESDLCLLCVARVTKGQQDGTLYCSNLECNSCVCIACLETFFTPCIGICRGSTCPDCIDFECEVCGDIACQKCVAGFNNEFLFKPCPRCSKDHCSGCFCPKRDPSEIPKERQLNSEDPSDESEGS